MTTKFLLLIAVSCGLLGAQAAGSKFTVLPGASNTAPGCIGFRGLSSTNEARLCGPSSVASTFTVRIPDAAPAFSAPWTCRPDGTCSFESIVGTPGGTRVETGSASTNWYRANVGRVLISTGGGSPGAAGIVRVFSGATTGSEVLQAGMDEQGITSWKKFSACEPTSGFCATLEGSVSMTGNIRWILPPTDAAGLMRSDGLGNLTIDTAAGFVDLTSAQTAGGDKDWTGRQRVGTPGAARMETSAAGVSNWYSGSNVARILLSAGATGSTVAGIVRVFAGTPGAETFAAGLDNAGVTSLAGFRVGDIGSSVTAIDSARGGFLTSLLVGTSGAARVTTSGGNANFYNTDNVSRVLVSNGGPNPLAAGIVRVFSGAAGSETLIAGMDATGFDTTTRYAVNGTQVIDSFRNVTANTLTASAGTFTGGLTILGGCSGCTSGWTLNTTQAGLSGDKTTSGNLKLTGSGSASIEMRAATNDIEVRNTSGALRAYMGTSTGLFATYSGSMGLETPVIRITPTGVDMNNFSQAGQTTTVTVSGCTMTFNYGWLTAKSGC
jgi:hypothetical protein